MRRLRAQLKAGAIDKPTYERLVDQQIALAIGVQEGLGLDVLVHGEAERTDMSEHFGARLGRPPAAPLPLPLPLPALVLFPCPAPARARPRACPPPPWCCALPLQPLLSLSPPFLTAHHSHTLTHTITRMHMQTGMQLDGMVFTLHGWVQSYGSRYVRPPIVAGDVKFVAPMTVREFKVAQVGRHGADERMRGNGWEGVREGERG